MHRQSEKKLVKQQYLLHMPHNMVNFGPLAAEIVSLVWRTPASFNGFGVLASLLQKYPKIAMTSVVCNISMQSLVLR